MNSSNRIVPLGHMAAPVRSSTAEWWHSELLEYMHDAVIVWELGVGALSTGTVRPRCSMDICVRRREDGSRMSF